MKSSDRRKLLGEKLEPQPFISFLVPQVQQSVFSGTEPNGVPLNTPRFSGALLEQTDSGLVCATETNRQWASLYHGYLTPGVYSSVYILKVSHQRSGRPLNLLLRM